MRPPWVARVCKHRQHFQNVMLIFGADSSADAFILGYGSQNPYWAVFTRAYLVDENNVPLFDDSLGMSSARSSHLFVWALEHKDYFFEDHNLLQGPPSNVVPDVRFESYCMCWSDSAAMPFDAFVAAMPEVKPSTSKAKTSALEFDDTLAAKHPWTRRVMKKSSEAKLRKDFEVVSDTEGAMEAAEVAEVMAAVDDAHLELAAADLADGDFVVEPRGGVFTKKAKGLL